MARGVAFWTAVPGLAPGACMRVRIAILTGPSVIKAPCASWGTVTWRTN